MKTITTQIDKLALCILYSIRVSNCKIQKTELHPIIVVPNKSVCKDLRHSTEFMSRHISRSSENKLNLK